MDFTVSTIPVAVAPAGSDVTQGELDDALLALVEQKYREALSEIATQAVAIIQEARDLSTRTATADAPAIAHGLGVMLGAANAIRRAIEQAGRRAEARTRLAPSAPSLPSPATTVAQEY